MQRINPVEQTGVGRGVSGKNPIRNKALPPKEFRVYRQLRSLNVARMHLRSEETDTGKPTGILRQPQTNSAGYWPRKAQVAWSALHD